MPVRDIRTRLSLDGEKEFKDALADARREMRVMGSELKLAAAEFQATGDQQGFMAQKSRILGEQIAQQEEIVRSLAERLEYSREHYKDNTRQIDDYAIQLNNARRALIQMRGELDENTQAMAELGNRTRLDEANNEIAKLASELKVAQAEFEATGNREDYLSARSRVLRQEIAQQEQAVEALNAAVTASAARHGENSAETARATVRANEATASLIRMRKELEDTDREAEELGRDSRRVGSQIEDGIGDAADETQGKLEDMFAALSRDVGTIRGSMVFSVATDVAGAVKDAMGTLAGIADSTREDRQRISLLNFNAENAGLDPTRINMLRMMVASITGDQDAAVEGISNLIASGMNWAQIQSATYALLGAWTQMPGTMEFQSMAESIREIVSTGEATGDFTNLLGLMGRDTEEFQAALDNAATEAGRLNAVMGYLYNTDLTGYFDSYRTDEANQTLLDAQKAQFELQEQINALGENIDELFLTDLKNFGVDVLTAVNDTLKEINENGLWATIDSRLKEAMTPIERGAEIIRMMNEGADYDTATEAVGERSPRQQRAEIERLQNEEGMSYNEAMMRDYAAQMGEEYDEDNWAVKAALWWEDFVNSLFGTADTATGEVDKRLQEMIELRDAILAEADLARESGHEDEAAEWEAMAEEQNRMIAERTAEIEAYKQAQDALISGTEADIQGNIDDLRAERTQLEAQLAQATNEGDEQGAAAIQKRLDEIAVEIEAHEATLKETGAGMAGAVAEGMTDGSASIANAGDAAAARGMSALASGIYAYGGTAVSAAWDVVRNISAVLERVDVSPATSALASASRAVASATGRNRGGNVNVNVQVDGRTVARASAPYMDAEMGRLAQRNA